MKYTVVVEEGATSYGAFVPDLPGCVAAAETREEVLHLIQEAMDFHSTGIGVSKLLSKEEVEEA